MDFGNDRVMDATSAASSPGLRGEPDINGQQPGSSASSGVSAVEARTLETSLQSSTTLPPVTEVMKRKTAPVKTSSPHLSDSDDVEKSSEKPVDTPDKKKKRRKRRKTKAKEGLTGTTAPAQQTPGKQPTIKALEATPPDTQNQEQLFTAILSGDISKVDSFLSRLGQFLAAPEQQSVTAASPQFVNDVVELHLEGLKALKQGNAKRLHSCFMEVIHRISPAPDDSPGLAAIKQEAKKAIYENTKQCYELHLDHLQQGCPLAKYIISLGWLYSCLADNKKAALEAAMMVIVSAHRAQVSFNKDMSKRAMLFVNTTLKEAKDLDPEFRVILAARVVSHYIQLHDCPPELWQLIDRERMLALHSSLPSEKLQLYWHHYQILAQFYRARCQQNRQTEQALKWNEYGLKALGQSIRHGSATAYWELGQLKLGVHPFLTDPRLTSTGKSLCDCFQAEHHFRSCSQMTLPFPIGAENIKKMYEKEAALLSRVSKLEPNFLMDFALDRLLGGFVLGKDKAKAKALMHLLPDFEALRLRAEQLLHNTPYPGSEELKKNMPGLAGQHKEGSDVSAKMLFFAGIEALHNKQKKLAKTYFTASALGGFAGGVTKLAYQDRDQRQQNALLTLASEMGDISAWQAMGDIHVGNQQLDKALLCYQKAIKCYQELGFHDEASILEELVTYMVEPGEGSSEARKRPGPAATEALPIPVPEKNTELPILIQDPADQNSITLLPVDQPQPASHDDSVLPGKTDVAAVKTDRPKESSLFSQVPEIIAASPVLVAHLPAVHITGRVSKWAKEMMRMQNEVLGVLHGQVKIGDCRTDVNMLIDEAVLDPFSRQYQRKFLNNFPVQVFTYSTWLALRENMDDDRATLFCNTAATERKHAEINMLEYLEPRLETRGIHSIEILISRNPCEDEVMGKGGCWNKIRQLVKKHPDIRWHIRFIMPGGRHRYPKQSKTGGRERPILPFNKRENRPVDWSQATDRVSALQEQVMESLDIPNLSYSVVPSYIPEELASYYGEEGAEKFNDDRFNQNPHYPGRQL